MSLSSLVPVSCRGGVATASALSSASVSLWKLPSSSSSQESAVSHSDSSSSCARLRVSSFASGDVVGLAVDTRFRSRIWTAQSTGVLRVFDATDGALLREVTLDLPGAVVHMAMAKSIAWILAHAGGGEAGEGEKRDKNGGRVAMRLWAVHIGDETDEEKEEEDEDEHQRHQIDEEMNKGKKKKKKKKKEKQQQQQSNTTRWMQQKLKTYTRARPVVSRDGCGVASFDRFTSYFWRSDGKSGELPLTHTKTILCVALHPECHSLAAGDESGRVIVWHIRDAMRDENVSNSNKDNGGGDTVLHNGDRGGDGRGRHDDATKMSRKKEQKKQKKLMMNAGLTGPPKSSTYHWHASGVRCMSFTADGRRLLTGGDERVLVAWDLEEGGTRSFYPRLGGAIQHILPDEADEARAWCVCSDNAVRLVGLATRTIVAQGEAIKPRPRGLKYEWMLRFNRGTAESGSVSDVSKSRATKMSKEVLIAAPDAAVQLCDYARGEHRGSTMRVAPRTVTISPKLSSDDRRKPAAAAVTLAASCLDGAAFVTVDVRASGDAMTAHGDEGWGGGSGSVCCLRFWERSSHGSAAGSDWANALRVVTVTDDPHEGGNVVDLSGAGREGVVASVCDRGVFKIWSRREVHRTAYFDPPAHSPQSHWICTASGSYRQLPFASLAFSPDASVLAIGTRSPSVDRAHVAKSAGKSSSLAPPPLLTLWDVHRTELATVAACAYYSGSRGRCVSWLAFVGGRHGGDPRIALLVSGQRDEPGGGGVLAIHSLLSPGTPRWTLRLERVTARPSASISCSSFAVSCRLARRTALGSDEKTKKTKDLVLVLDASAQSARSAVRCCFETRREGVAALLCEDGEVVVMTRDRRFDVGRFQSMIDKDSESVGGVRDAVAGLSEEEKEGRVVSKQPPSSLFENVYGRLPSDAGPDERPASSVDDASVSDSLPAPCLPAPGISPWRSLFDAPSHVLPPMSDLVLPFLGTYTSSS